jgi:vitamin B12 transporter
VDFGLTGTDQQSDYDSTSNPNALNTVHKQLLTGYAKVSDTSFDDLYDQSLTGFVTIASRHNVEPPSTVFDYRSTVAGAEYQGIADLRQGGTLLFGARAEHEVASYSATGSDSRISTVTSVFYALFAQHEVTFGDRFHVSSAAATTASRWHREFSLRARDGCL